MKKFMGVMVLCLSFIAQAGAVGKIYSGYVLNVRVDRSGLGYIRFDRALADTPASCISGHPNHLSFDTKTPAGVGIMKLALSAKALSRPIIAKGIGSCPGYGVVEAWGYGWMQ